MLPCLAEDLHDKIGSTVYHLRVVEEVLRRIHVTRQAHTARDATEISVARGFEVRKHIHRREPGRLLPLVDRQLAAELANKAANSILNWYLAGKENQVVHHNGADVVARGLGLRRNVDAKRCQACVDCLCHDRFFIQRAPRTTAMIRSSRSA